jgi:hypothetical protein
MTRLIGQAAAGCRERQLCQSTEHAYAHEHRQDHLAEMACERELAAAAARDAGLEAEGC